MYVIANKPELRPGPLKVIARYPTRELADAFAAKANANARRGGGVDVYCVLEEGSPTPAAEVRAPRSRKPAKRSRQG